MIILSLLHFHYYYHSIYPSFMQTKKKLFILIQIQLANFRVNQKGCSVQKIR